MHTDCKDLTDYMIIQYTLLTFCGIVSCIILFVKPLIITDFDECYIHKHVILYSIITAE